MGTWKSGCPVDIDRLRLIKFRHYDFSDKEQEGEIVVLDAVASRVALIFETLYQYKFPIAQAKTIEHFQGQDKPALCINPGLLQVHLEMSEAIRLKKCIFLGFSRLISRLNA